MRLGDAIASLLLNTALEIAIHWSEIETTGPFLINVMKCLDILAIFL